MKFIIPNYSLQDNFTDNVSFTLRKMGHEVLTVPKPTHFLNHRLMHLMQIAYDKVFPLSLTPQEKWLKNILREYRPDVVLALTQELNEELLYEVKKVGAISISWWGDTPANMRKQGLLCKNWDFIYIKDEYAAFKMRTLDLNACYLPEAMNPDWHKKCYRSINGEIVFAGNAYNYRHYLIRKLIETGYNEVSLYGDKPPKWSSELVKASYKDKFIVKEEKSEIFGSGFACVNSTAMSEGNSINCRAFEIAGAGGLQIMEYRQAIENCFIPGQEILVYSSFDELITIIEKYKKDRGSAIKIREGGYRRALNEHTYQHRLKVMIDNLHK